MTGALCQKPLSRLKNEAEMLEVPFTH